MKTIFDLREKKETGIYERIKMHFREEVKVFQFSEMGISSCLGCWDCWLKTPGRCVLKDEMTGSYSQYVNSETVILLIDTAQGFINHRGKAFIDRSIPHYHPYIRLVDGECRHLPRYKKLPDMVFHFDREGLTPEEEGCIEDYLYRTAYQFNVKGSIIDGGDSFLKPLNHRKAKRGRIALDQADSMEKLIIYNGSPRRKKANTGLILDQVRERLGAVVEIRDLKNRDKWREWTEAFQNEEHVMLFLPLYVHGMPSHVMEFIEGLGESKGTITFFIQSGFPESGHSHYLEAYFELLSLRLQRVYLGTIIKGGMEGLQARPTEAQKSMIKPLVDVVEILVKEGRIPAIPLKELAKPEKLSVAGKMFMRSGAINFFWDQHLKKNNALGQKNDRPYQLPSI